MKSRTAYFSLPFFCNTLRRFMPFTLLYTVIMILSGPVSTAYTMSTRYASISDLNITKISGYGSALFGSGFSQYNSFGAIHSIPWIFAIILGVLLFNYLHKKNALDLYHSIPLKRETIFITYTLLGLVLLAVPMLLCFVANMIIISAYKLPGLLNPFAYLSNVSIEILLMLTIFLMVIFVSFISDTIANNALLAVYLFSISFVFITVTSIFFYNELFGYAIGDVVKNSYRFTPFLRAFAPSLLSFNWLDIVFFSALVFTLFFLIILLYKKRKREAVSRGFASSVFCWTAAYLGAICGYLTALSSRNTGWKIFWYIAGGTILWAISNVIINRGFKRLLPTWKQFLAFQLAVGLFFFCVKFDFIGFEKRIPNVKDISQVTFNYSWNLEGYSEFSNNYSSSILNNPLPFFNNYSDNSYNLLYLSSLINSSSLNSIYTKNNFIYKDPQNIKIITELHKTILEDYKMRDKSKLPATKNGYFLNETKSNPIGLAINYKLKSNLSQTRTYIYPESEIKKQLMPLFNSEEYKKQAFDIFKNNAENPYSKANIIYDNYSSNNSTGGTKSKEVINKLIDEIKKDILSLDFNILQQGVKPIYSIALYDEKDNNNIVKRLPVYDSFANTKKFLQDSGIISKNLLPLSEVTSIDVTGNASQHFDSKLFPMKVTDQNQIRDLYNDVIRLNQSYQNYICIDVNYKDGHYSNVMINLDFAPKWLLDKINYQPQLTYSSYSPSSSVKVSSNYISSSSTPSSKSYIYASRPSSSSQPSTSLQTVDDTVTGTALGQFNFSGSWSKVSQASFYNGSINSTDQAGYYEFKFVGSNVQIFANKDVSYGFSKVEIDGNTVKTIDQYSPFKTDRFPIYSSNYLSYGEHTIRVTNLMQKSSNSTGTFISVDFIRYS